MTKTTGLSGNEIYCLSLKGYQPGNIVVGNSVHSLGFVGSIRSTFRSIIGGELQQITSLIEEGRETAYKRMEREAAANGATGITGVTSELIFHGGNIEFLSIGSAVHAIDSADKSNFSTSDNGQHLYAQLDAGFKPVCFAFGNVAYAMGVGRGITGSFKTLARGEIREYSDMFNHTRHLALERIIAHAQQLKANSVMGIHTTILPFGGVSEMLMIGTASRYKELPAGLENMVLTSDMTNVEMWNMQKLGFMPMKLLLGTSVYSLGFIGGLTSLFKSFVRGEINELTRLIYDARENAIGLINQEAKSIGADDIVGVKTYVYEIGGGLVEFLAIGTAVKKVEGIKPASEQLPPQAIIVDEDTFYDTNSMTDLPVNVNAGVKPAVEPRGSFIGMLIFLGIMYLFYKMFTMPFSVMQESMNSAGHTKQIIITQSPAPQPAPIPVANPANNSMTPSTETKTLPAQPESVLAPYQFNLVMLNGQNRNQIAVNKGETVDIKFSVSAPAGVDCPGCVAYFLWGYYNEKGETVSQSCALGNSCQITTGSAEGGYSEGGGMSANCDIPFVPQVPGTYYFTAARIWDYSCKPTKFDPQVNKPWAIIQVK